MANNSLASLISSDTVPISLQKKFTTLLHSHISLIPNL